ncbi:MAG: class II glutamine amidotransferase [Coriobacteriales bacterium]|jgi:glutamine amidotransferase|nr:class II glutamine amidotransferase [Coriobacteriales bacterium]
MCQLFAINSRKPLDLRSQLREFFSHADENPHGWGFADFSQRGPEIVRCPQRADTSAAAEQLLAHPIQTANALAHIRFATVGQVDAYNCHPFTTTDSSSRRWTLIHKGTIFDYEPLNPYFRIQRGTTDSERILLYLVDAQNQALAEKGAPLEADERFAVFSRVCAQLAPGNCVNLIAYDSDMLFVHTNYQGAINLLQADGLAIFCTSELAAAAQLVAAPMQATTAEAAWQPLSLNTPLAFKHGAEVLRGEDHGQQYFDREEDTRYLYQDFAAL